MRPGLPFAFFLTFLFSLVMLPSQAEAFVPVPPSGALSLPVGQAGAGILRVDANVADAEVFIDGRATASRP